VSEPADEVLACAERTLNAASARVQLCQQLELPLPHGDSARRGGLLRPLVRLAARLARKAFERMWERWPGEMCSDGFIEPSRRRSMTQMGNWAELRKEGERWKGRPGRPLAGLEASPDRGSGVGVDLWWLLDALRGVTEAGAKGEEQVRGSPCRRLSARVDLARASAAAPEGLPPPLVDRFEELLALPLDVWIDGSHVRRVRYEGRAHGKGALTLELWEFGVGTDGLDWSRLPRWPCP
jgi:hypothetical protein